jgi:hypothetical protein
MPDYPVGADQCPFGRTPSSQADSIRRSLMRYSEVAASPPDRGPFLSHSGASHRERSHAVACGGKSLRRLGSEDLLTALPPIANIDEGGWRVR